MRSRDLFLALWLGLPLTAVANSDPTAPLGFESQAPAAVKRAPRLPTLQAILCQAPTDCSAVLNGKSVNQGGRINGFTVSDINDNRVVLQRDGKRWTLNVFNQQVVQ